MTGDPMLTAALAAAEHGIEILPLHRPWRGGCSCRRPDCGSPGKHPLLKHGLHEATTDPAIIRGWWRRWPGANLGLRPRTGEVVLDVDPRNGGDATLNALEAEHGPLPPTRTAITGSDGLHFWLRGAATVGRLGPGVDVKTNSGYVTGPPSTHICGGTYLWTTEGPAQPAPAWLANLLAPAPPVRPLLGPGYAGTEADCAGVLAVVLSARQGSRNHALHWAACRLFERVAAGRLNDGQAEGMLLDAAQRIGLPHSETRATIGSARRSVPGAA